jgi:hypothetical protein
MALCQKDPLSPPSLEPSQVYNEEFLSSLQRERLSVMHVSGGYHISIAGCGNVPQEKLERFTVPILTEEGHGHRRQSAPVE